MATELVEFAHGENYALELPADMGFDKWDALGKTFEVTNRAIQWWLGDWWLYGEKTFGEKASQAVGLQVRTLQQYAYVCDFFPPEKREPSVDFTHHSVIAYACKTKRQGYAMIKKCAAEGWSVRELKKQFIVEADDKPAEQSALGSWEELRDEDAPKPKDKDPWVVSRKVKKPLGECVRLMDRLAELNGGEGKYHKTANRALNTFFQAIEAMAGGSK